MTDDKNQSKEDDTVDIWNVPKIDVHVHIGKDKDDEDKNHPSKLYKDMKEYNIRKAVIFPFNTGPKDGFKDANNTIHRLVKKYDPLIGFSRIDPNHPAWEKEMERAIDLDMKGLKLHPYAQYFECDEIDFIYEKATELNLPILIHSAHKEGKYIDQLKDILPSFTNIPIILAHAGITEQSDAIKMANEQDNIYMDLSINKKHRVEVLSLMVEDDKMMFGSDTPYGGVKKTLHRMDVEWRSEETIKKVFYKNAKKVLNI